MGKTLLFTGHPGSGKSTVIKKLAVTLGEQAGGFYTREVFGAGGRKGFEIVTLDGKVGLLAHKDYHGPDTLFVGRYGVDVTVMERVGLPAVRAAMEAGKIVVIDGLGAIELCSKEFGALVITLILGPATVLGTAIYKPHPQADLYKTLGPVTLWEVNRRNRNLLPEKALHWLRKIGAVKNGELPTEHPAVESD